MHAEWWSKTDRECPATVRLGKVEEFDFTKFEHQLMAEI